MIPLALIRGLERYREDHLPTGSFLRSVLCGELFEAALRADAESSTVLAAVALHVMRELPADSWGSREKVNAWLDPKP